MGNRDPLAAMQKNIRQSGWGAMHIEGSELNPEYSYTVGLVSSFGHPEIIVFGLNPSKAEALLTTIEHEIRAGHRFEPLTVSDRVLQGFMCAFRQASPPAVRALIGVAVRLYGYEPSVLHCIWPDKNNRFPWDAGAKPEYRRMQPMLSDGPEPSTSVRPEARDETS